MSNAKAGGVLVAGLLLGAGLLNMGAEAITGKPLLDGGVGNGGNHSAVADTQAAPTGTWTIPTSGEVTTGYKVPGKKWILGYHTGIDFPVRTGTRVKAAGSGEVVAAGWGGKYGNHVLIKHKDGFYTEYAHLSQLYVSKGAKVTTGMPIALSGNSGNSSGPHLHFEVRTGPNYGDDIDPVAFLRKRNVNL